MTCDIIGIDCAVDESHMGLAFATFEEDTVTATNVSTRSGPGTAVSTISKWIDRDGIFLIAIDAPLGWPGDKRLSARILRSMMFHHTVMPKTKVALTLDSDLIERVDELVERRRFRNRSQAVEAALADKLRRLARTRLALESAKLNSREEKRLAEEGLADDLKGWPEY